MDATTSLALWLTAAPIAICLVLAVVQAFMAGHRRHKYEDQRLDARPCTQPWPHDCMHDGWPRLEEVHEVPPRSITAAADKAHDERVKRFVANNRKRRIWNRF